MPKRVLGKQVGTIHKVEKRWTIGEIAWVIFLIWLILAIIGGGS